MSLPSWECGLKFSYLKMHVKRNSVTPLVGVWIEIKLVFCIGLHNRVTPLVGVWIEMN